MRSRAHLAPSRITTALLGLGRRGEESFLEGALDIWRYPKSQSLRPCRAAPYPLSKHRQRGPNSGAFPAFADAPFISILFATTLGDSRTAIKNSPSIPLAKKKGLQLALEPLDGR